MEIFPFKIQLISIAGSLLFMLFISRLIVKGKLREEFAIIWMVCTLFLLFFALWRNGLEIIARLLGVFYAPSLIFLAATFAIILFLVHLSVINSKQQKQIKEMAQEIALIKQKNKSEDKTS